MSSFKKRRWLSVLATLFALTAVFGVAAPAQAVTWYQHVGNCGTFFTNYCTVEYTGAWPDGYVRALGDLSEYEVALRTKTSPTGSYTTVAVAHSGDSTWPRTPAVKAGKWNYYIACMRTVAGGQLWCSSNGAIYLGD